MLTKEQLDSIKRNAQNGYAYPSDTMTLIQELLDCHYKNLQEIQRFLDVSFRLDAALARADRAEASLAAMTERKEYFRQCWEVAEAALAERDAPCVWTQVGDGYNTGCIAWYASDARQNHYSFCPNCGHPVSFVLQADL